MLKVTACLKIEVFLKLKLFLNPTQFKKSIPKIPVARFLKFLNYEEMKNLSHLILINNEFPFSGDSCLHRNLVNSPHERQFTNSHRLPKRRWS